MGTNMAWFFGKYQQYYILQNVVSQQNVGKIDENVINEKQQFWAYT